MNADFPEHADENRRIWNANARGGTIASATATSSRHVLIEPSSERLLDVSAADTILDVACGAGRFARRMASLGATVVAIDTSSEFIARARQRTPADASIDYRVLDAARLADLRSLDANRFTKAVCTMALMDMPEIAPLFRALSQLLPQNAAFVFSVLIPAFIRRRFSASPRCTKRALAGTSSAPASRCPPTCHRRRERPRASSDNRSRSSSFIAHSAGCSQEGFDAGFVVDGFEEPGFPPQETPRPAVKWENMPDVPPILVVRMRRRRIAAGR